jgi:hypothetical protein
MPDDEYEKIESTSLEIYIISDRDYILKRTIEQNTDYYYCNLGVPGIPDETVNTIRGNLYDGKISFQRKDFNFEILVDDLAKLEYKKLW